VRGSNDQKRSAQWVFSFAIGSGGQAIVRRGHGGALAERWQGQGSPEELVYKAAKYRQGPGSSWMTNALAEELERQATKGAQRRIRPPQLAASFTSTPPRLARAAPNDYSGSETRLLLIRGELRRLAATIHRLKLVYVFLGLL